MKPRIFNLIILDESGSMESIKQSAINSVNETFQTIRADVEEDPEQEQFVTFVTFDSRAIKTVYNRKPIGRVANIDEKVYRPCAGTPLFDAVGTSINALRPKVTEDDRVLVTIVTDGYENSSREYTGHDVKKLIESLKKQNWVFVYMGANHDVEAVATKIAIHNTYAFSADCKGFGKMTSDENASRKKLYARMKDVCFCSLNEDEAYFEK